MNDLEKYFLNNQGRKMRKWIHYFEVYDRHFRHYRNQDVYVLEIGVCDGGSLPMWKEYFGPKAKIFGVDIDPRCQVFEEDRVQVFIGSQEDRSFLQFLVSELPRIDILIDDGGHTMKQQINTFEEIFPHISENGVYLCEDLHTSYWSGYGGGYQNPESFIEYSKNLIDRLNAWHSKEKTLQISSFTKSAYSMHYYDSMLVIEKRKMLNPVSKGTGIEGLLSKEETEQTIELYKKEIESNPKQSFRFYRGLGDTLSQNNRDEEAIDAYLKAIQIRDDFPEIYHSLGNIQNKTNDLEGAILSYEKAIELNSKRKFKIYQNLGDIFIQKGKLEKAISSYQESIELEPSKGVLYRKLGKAKHKFGDLNGAIASYRTAIKLDERDSIAYKSYGDVLRSQGKLKEAIDAYQKSIHLNPDYVAAKQALKTLSSVE